MTTDDAKPIIRTLRDVLADARAHVEVAEVHFRGLLLESRAEDAAEVLERLDGAIAEADEVLS